MTITLKDVPLNEWQKMELKDALQSIADLLVDAYDAGYDTGYMAQAFMMRGKTNEGH